MKQENNVNRAENAKEEFISKYNCAQSVFSSFAEELGLEKDFALRASTGFGSGMGRRQYVCGAVSGGVMVINMLYGRGEADDKEVQNIAYAKVREFICAFEDVHGTSMCRELLDGVELLTEKGQARFERENMRGLCAEYVKSAVELLEPLIKEKIGE